MVQPMKLQQGGSGGVVVCLGVGGLVDTSSVLGLDSGDRGEDLSGGIEVWLIDARRPWNLGNVFEGDPAAIALREISGDATARNPHVDNGRILPSYKPGQGGIIVYDDGDIDEDLGAEREAYCELTRMQGVEDYGEDSGDSGDESEVIESIEVGQSSKKRKSWSDRDDEDDDSQDENRRPRQRRRSSSVCVVSICTRQTIANTRNRRAPRPIPPDVAAATAREFSDAPLKGHLPLHRKLRHRDHRNNHRCEHYVEGSSVIVESTLPLSRSTMLQAQRTPSPFHQSCTPWPRILAAKITIFYGMPLLGSLR